MTEALEAIAASASGDRVRAGRLEASSLGAQLTRSCRTLERAGFRAHGPAPGHARTSTWPGRRAPLRAATPGRGRLATDALATSDRDATGRMASTRLPRMRPAAHGGHGRRARRASSPRPVDAGGPRRATGSTRRSAPVAARPPRRRRPASHGERPDGARRISPGWPVHATGSCARPCERAAEHRRARRALTIARRPRRRSPGDGTDRAVAVVRDSRVPSRQLAIGATAPARP